MTRLFFILGSLSAFLSVALGAFGAHGLKDKVSSDMLAVFQTGVQYQMFHALALFIVAWACAHWPAASFAVPGWLFVAGTVVFSGSLYVLSVSGQRWLGAVTPIGGLFFLLGWLSLAWTAWRAQ